MRACLALSLVLILAGCAAPVVSPAAGPTAVSTSGSVDRSSIATVRLVLHRSATCSCCHLHLAHLRDAGWQVDDMIDADMTMTKDRMGIPAAARSCHTTIAGRYWVEGHVPSAVIERLLREQPDLDGIAVPGMPEGAPGMGGAPDPTLEIVGVKDGQIVGVFAVGA